MGEDRRGWEGTGGGGGGGGGWENPGLKQVRPLYSIKIEFTNLVPPPLHAHLLHGHHSPSSGSHLPSHIPCTCCRSNFTSTTGGARERAGSPQNRPPCAIARFTAANSLSAISLSCPTPPAPAAVRILLVPPVVRENEPGCPRIAPPARSLASWLPTLSQPSPSHVPHPLHLLQFEFY